MEQPWWVYGLIAVACAVFFLLIKVIERKFMREDEDLGIMSFVVGFAGFFAAWKAAEAVNLFG